MTTPDDSILDIRSLPTSSGAVIVAVAGDIDVSSAALLRAELQHVTDGGARHIVIDATDLMFMDSSGISVLVALQKWLQRRGGHVEVRNVNPAVRKPLDIMGVSDFIPVQTLDPEERRRPDGEFPAA